MRYLLIGLLRAYRLLISPLYGQVCRYHPSCSAYALEAVTEHGSAARAAGWPCAGWLAATPGPPAATTPCRPAESSRARRGPLPTSKEPDPWESSATSATSS